MNKALDLAAAAILAVIAVACTPRTEKPAPAGTTSVAVAPKVTATADPAPSATTARIVGPEVETTILDARSAYSHFLVRDHRTTRSLLFVRDSGEIVLESAIDRATPHNLLVDYTRVMFVSYLFIPEQKRALIVGLGGGAMVHFLNHFAPTQRVDVVEIDPAIVKAADELFGVRSSATVKIITEDAFKYLPATSERYDVVYMDAFLKPAADTDSTGVPLRMKTIRFLKDIQKTLLPGGIVVFNLNEHERTDEDLSTIRSAFAQTYVFFANEGNLVVVGATSPDLVTRDRLDRNAESLDARKAALFSFRGLARQLAERRVQP